MAEDFLASSRWIKCFKRHRGLHSILFMWEAATADKEAEKNFFSGLLETFKKEALEARVGV